MSDRTYTEQEVASLLERAAELQLQRSRRPEDRPGLTLGELQAIAAETGLDPALLRQAAAELDAPSRPLLDASTGTSNTHVFIERSAPGPLTSDAWEDIVAELRHRFDTDLGRMMGTPGMGTSSTEQIGRTVEWRHTSLAGVETRVMIRTRDEGLRIRLSQRVGWGSPLAEASTYGALLAFFVAFTVGAVASSGWAGLAAFVLALCATIPLITYADRAWRAKKHRELNALADRVVALAQPTGAAPLAAPLPDAARTTAPAERDAASPPLALPDPLLPDLPDEARERARSERSRG